ncbi:PDZ domain-containing protein, partial [bacterium]
VKDMADVVQQPGDYSFSYNTHVDGIMGFEVIKDVITEINFEKKKFIFYPKTLDINKRTPDNKKTFLNKLLPIGSGSLEMFAEAPSGKKLTLALDTGNSFYATTHKDVLERVGLWSPGKEAKYMTSAGVASGVVDAFYMKMPAMKIFNVPVAESHWDIIDLPSSSAEGDGTIGFGFLKNFNIVIDYERRRVWMDNFTGQVVNEAEGDIGIVATNNRKTKRTVIFKVSPDTPAAAAGIKEGDEVLSVDGKELIDVGYDRFKNLMRGKVGEKVKLAISRNGTLMRYELERKSLMNTTD